MRKPLKLPDFKNEDEVQEFMDTTDFSEYLEPSDLKKISFPNLKRTKRLLSIRVDEALIEKAKKGGLPLDCGW